MLKAVSDALATQGFDIVPEKVHGIKSQLIQDASGANQNLIKFLAEFDFPTKVYRPGEKEAEVGLVHRKPEDGKDVKYFLHTAHDFWDLVKAEPKLYRALRRKAQREQVEVILRLYKELAGFVMGVLTHLRWTAEFPLLENDLRQSFLRSITESHPDSTTTLRGLLYQAEENHKGASIHPDRSFITPHGGDFGGTLQAHKSIEEGGTIEISPTAGEIAIFLGAKAEIYSGGKLRALWHSATTRPDEDRSAMVMFGHVITPDQIDDARESLRGFWKANGITNPDEHYQEFFNR